MRSPICRLRVGVGAQRRGVVGLHVAGRDRVDVDAVRRPFVGERLGELRDAALGRGVAGHGDAALEREQRRDVDDLAAAAAVEHVAAGGAAQPEDARQVHVDHRRPSPSSSCSAAGCAADDAGVVDEDVEAAERRERVGDEPIARRAASRRSAVSACVRRPRRAAIVARPWPRAACVLACSDDVGAGVGERRPPSRRRARARRRSRAPPCRRGGRDRATIGSRSAAPAPAAGSPRGSARRCRSSTTSSSSIVAPCRTCGREVQHVARPRRRAPGRRW